MKYLAGLFLTVFLAGCPADSKLVNYQLPQRPESCTDRSKELSEKDVKRDLDQVNAVKWHVDDRVRLAEELAKLADCQRFLDLTWKRMQSKK